MNGILILTFFENSVQCTVRAGSHLAFAFVLTLKQVASQVTSHKCALAMLLALNVGKHQRKISQTKMLGVNGP